MRAVLVLAAALLAGCASSGGVQPEQSAAVAEQATLRQILVTVRQPATLAAGLTGAPNQRYLQRRYGPSPTAFVILPLVSAFFVDIVNVGAISLFLKL